LLFLCDVVDGSNNDGSLRRCCCGDDDDDNGGSGAKREPILVVLVEEHNDAEEDDPRRDDDFAVAVDRTLSSVDDGTMIGVVVVVNFVTNRSDKAAMEVILEHPRSDKFLK